MIQIVLKAVSIFNKTIKYQLDIEFFDKKKTMTAQIFA